MGEYDTDQGICHFVKGGKDFTETFILARYNTQQLGPYDIKFNILISTLSTHLRTTVKPRPPTE